MYTNDTQSSKDFLIPSSIPRILQSNRQYCALHSQISNGSQKKLYISPKKSQQDSQYTFEPRVNSSHKTRRSLEQFVQDQEKFQIERERKVTQMREQITKWSEEEVKGIPQINSKRKKQTSRDKSNSSVFERLSKEKLNKSTQKNTYSFHPQILPKSKQLHRAKTGTDLLYEDAKRRNSKHKIIKQTEEKKIASLSTPKINSNTNDLVRRKILSEFMQLISDSVLNPLLALSILEELFNVKLRDIGSPFVRRILDLIVSDNGEVLTQKLWSFIAVIIGNNEGCFPEDEEDQIKANYGFFYKERINKEKKCYTTSQEPQFRPKILQSSEQLAEKHRQKLCKKASQFIEQERIHLNIENEEIALEDLLIIDHMQRKKQNEKLKMQKQNKQIQQCTFKPKLTPKLKQKQKIVLRYPLKQQKQSHNIPKKSSKEATDRFENTCKTFNSVEKKKSLEKTYISNEKKTQIYQRNRKSMDSLSARMILARTERQFQNKMNLRSYTRDENWTQEYNRKHKKMVQNAQRMKGLVDS